MAAEERTAGAERLAEARASLLTCIKTGTDIGPRAREVLATLVSMLFDANEAIRVGHSKHETTGSALSELAKICEIVPAKLDAIERRLREMEGRHG